MELRDKNGLTESEFLAGYDASRFERPSVTVDIIAIREDRILLIRRGGHPFLGKLALPGGFLEPDEDAYAGAARELKEETGLDAYGLKMLPAATKPDRDPRTRIVTLPFVAGIKGDSLLAVAADDAADAGWYRYRLERDGNALTVTLIPENGDGRICFTVVRSEDKTSLRGDAVYTLRGESPMACDHAEIICMALDRSLR